MTQARIRSAFEAALQTWATGAGVAVAWEAVKFTPSGTYVRANLLPAATVSLDLLGKHRRYSGIFQVTVIAQDGRGLGAAEALLASLETAFPHTGKFTASGLTVQIVRPMSSASPFIADGEVALPCSFRYQTDIVVA